MVSEVGPPVLTLTNLMTRARAEIPEDCPYCTRVFGQWLGEVRSVQESML